MSIITYSYMSVNQFKLFDIFELEFKLGFDQTTISFNFLKYEESAIRIS